MEPVPHGACGVGGAKEHPVAGELQQVDPPLKVVTCEYAVAEAAAINKMTETKVLELLHAVSTLQSDTKQWRLNSPRAIRHVVQGLNGLVLRWVQAQTSDIDPELIWNMQNGFPLHGVLPKLQVAAQNGCHNPQYLEVAELAKARDVLNSEVLSGSKEDHLSAELHQCTVQDAEKGFMSEPKPVTAATTGAYNLARRIAVLEFREHEKTEENPLGRRLRIVVDMSANLVNAATCCPNRQQNESIDSLRYQTVEMMRAQKVLRLWKADVAKAYRKLASNPHHESGNAVTWRHAGVQWYSVHKVLCFGATSCVFGWHRFAGAIGLAILKWLRRPISRYVDDCYGADRADVEVQTVTLLGLVLQHVGPNLDPRKTELHPSVVTILGARLRVFALSNEIAVDCEPAKAARWSRAIEVALQTGKLPRCEAEKLAGQLSWTCQATADRTGRSQLRPLFEHANTAGETIMPWLRCSLQWWLCFLRFQPKQRQNYHAENGSTQTGSALQRCTTSSSSGQMTKSCARKCWG